MNSHDSITNPSPDRRGKRLDPERQIIPSDELVAVTLGEYGVQLASWDEAQDGIGHVVLHIRDVDQNGYYLKFYSAAHKHHKVVREADYMLQARRENIPVPDVYQTTAGNIVGRSTQASGVHSYILTSEIAGHSPEEYTPTYLKQLAEYHAQLHNLGLSSSDSKLDLTDDYHYYALKEGSQLADLAHTVTSATAPVLAQWDELPQGLTHLDISRTNILAAPPDITGIIDFEDLEQAPLVFCLAGTLWDIYESEAGSTEGVTSYVAHYDHHRTLSAIERSHLNEMVILRGWIALHGSLLTKGEEDTTTMTQEALLRELIEHPPLFA